MPRALLQEQISGQVVMIYQNLHNSVPHGTPNVLHAAYALLIPQSGAFFATIAGGAKTIAQVFLAPGGGLSGKHRKFALSHPYISFNVRGDWQRAPSPEDFSSTTLRWGIKNSNAIAIWSAKFPKFSDDVFEWGVEAINSGARFVTIIETVAERAAEWAAFVRRWKQAGASLRFFGPESVGGVQ